MNENIEISIDEVQAGHDWFDINPPGLSSRRRLTWSLVLKPPSKETRRVWTLKLPALTPPPAAPPSPPPASRSKPTSCETTRCRTEAAFTVPWDKRYFVVGNMKNELQHAAMLDSRGGSVMSSWLFQHGGAFEHPCARCMSLITRHFISDQSEPELVVLCLIDRSLHAADHFFTSGSESVQEVQTQRPLKVCLNTRSINSSDRSDQTGAVWFKYRELIDQWRRLLSYSLMTPLHSRILTIITIDRLMDRSADCCSSTVNWPEIW